MPDHVPEPVSATGSPAGGRPRGPGVTPPDDPVAVVGIGLRFPGGSTSPDEFADFLRAGRSGIRAVPEDRWDVPAFAADGGDPAQPGKIRSSRGGYLDRVDEFDAQFFAISPKEAQFTDPQQRMLLETAWLALEHANIDPSPLRRGSGGVFVGASSIDYALELDSLPYEALDGHLAAGITFFPLSGRLSYFLGWRGPCMTVDTACASSLTALHQAVVALSRGECDIALAGGVNALHHPRIPVIFSAANMLAPDGECKTFDEAADGYVRAEGCGVLVLKRLSDALAAGDRVCGLIRGTAVGQDGDSAGLTVPSGSAQTAVIRTALRAAGLAPADVQYVEAHGTGTALGDPIEMGAITDVFAESHTPAAPVVVGSVKTNLGHMEPVAGIVGVIKTLLQMRERTFYPHLNFRTPSPRIPWDRSPVTVPVECLPWEAPVRRAVVNSFGFGGTIAAAVLEQAPAVDGAAPAPEPDGTEPPRPVFTVSARSRRSLRLQLERYREHLDAHPDADVAELCRTANLGRAHHSIRLAVPVEDRDGLAALLDRRLAEADQPAPAGATAVRKVAFLFTGQGSQYLGMGAALYRQHPVFRSTVDECDELFAVHLGRSVRAMLLGTDPAGDDVHQTRFTQPALFTLEYALARLWLSWGIRPNALLGHSIGEVVAAAAAGLFDLPDAVTLVSARAELMQSVSTPGGMVAVSAAAEDVRPLLAPYPRLALAGINSPQQCVVSGEAGELAELTVRLATAGVRTTRLAVSHAFHSPLMAETYEEFAAALKGIVFREPRLTVISNVTGAVARLAEVGTVDYWVQHIGAPVDFEAGMRTLDRRGPHAVVELGPGPALTSLAKQCVDADRHRWFASTSRTDADGGAVRRALAGLYGLGFPVAWSAYHAGHRARTADLPTYAFDRKRYWLPNGATRGTAGGTEGPARHPLLGAERTTAEQRSAGVREFVTRLTAGQPAYLTDHRVAGQAVFPGTGYVEIALALQDAVFGETGRPVVDLSIHEPLFLAADRPTEVRTRLLGEDAGGARVEVVSRVDTDDGPVERRHATATIAAAGDPTAGDGGAELRAAAKAAGAPAAVLGTAEVYAEFAAVGMDYGPRFQLVDEVSRYGAALAVAVLQGADTPPAEHLPPAVLDGAMHALAAVAADDGDNFLPVRFGWLRLHKKPMAGRLRSVLRLAEVPEDGMDLTADLVLLEDDRPVAELRGLGLRRVADGARRQFFHELRWTKRSLAGPGAAPVPGRHAVLVGAGPRPALADAAAAGGVTLSTVDDADAAVELLDREPVTDLVWWWQPGAGPLGRAALRTECETNFRQLLDLLGRLEQHGWGRDRRLWLVTERGQWLSGDQAGTGEDLAAATLWGFGHVLLNEYPAYRATMVDLGGEPADERGLLAELQVPAGNEFQLAFRGGVRHVRRLRPARRDPRADEEVALAVVEPGRFGGIRPVPAPSPAPVGDQIQVLVHSAGINFKDVLAALGIVDPGPDGVLGFECAGTVVAAGPEAEFTAGDAVIVNHPGVMRRAVTVPSGSAVAKPDRLDFAAAGGVASAYVTAWYALQHLAGLRRGDRVLVHAAAGGVGQAAVQLARLAGAEVYATASPAKWPLLRAQGVEHVFSSRTLEFADQVLAATGGTGVDVVLNSLNKDYIEAGLRCLAPGGRFVELGKVGAWTPEQVAAVRSDAAYHNFDLSELPPADGLRLNREILRAVADRLADGSLPPLPVTLYGLDEAEEAFGVLSRGANIGKLVLDFGDRDAYAAPPIRLRPDRTYLVAGGLGGFGLVTAGLLVDRGARHLALVSRSGRPAPELAEKLAALRARAEVTVHAADIGEPADMDRLVATLSAAPYPVGGIVHAAGGLADAPIATQSWESIDDLLRAKVYGGWLLSEAADTFPELDFFLVHSSASSVVGGASQSNYAAANAFLDTLVQWRVRSGRPGTGLNWGPLAEVGMSARLSPQHVAALEREGIRLFTPGKATRSLAGVLDRPAVQLVCGECDWTRFVSAKPVKEALYEELTRPTRDGGPRLDVEVLRGQDRAERLAALDGYVRAKVAEVLHLEAAGEVDPGTAFTQLGLDSLVAVELKNALEAGLGLALPTSVAYDYPSATLLTEFLDQQLAGADPEQGVAA